MVAQDALDAFVDLFGRLLNAVEDYHSSLAHQVRVFASKLAIQDEGKVRVELVSELLKLFHTTGPRTRLDHR
jgi:hypothetical protein